MLYNENTPTRFINIIMIQIYRYKGYFIGKINTRYYKIWYHMYIYEVMGSLTYNIVDLDVCSVNIFTWNWVGDIKLYMLKRYISINIHYMKIITSIRINNT